MLRKATGAKLNSQKSKALPTGGWSHPATALRIKSHDQVTILGIRYGTTTAKSVKDSWTGALRAVRAQARKGYARTLCLAQRIQYVHLRLLAKIWYPAQILPPTKERVQQPTTVCTWFIRQSPPVTPHPNPDTETQKPLSATLPETGNSHLPISGPYCNSNLFSQTSTIKECKVELFPPHITPTKTFFLESHTVFYYHQKNNPSITP